MSIRRRLVWLLVPLVLLGTLYTLFSLGYWRGVRSGWTVSIPARFGHVWLEHQPWRMRDAAPLPADSTPFTVVYGPNVVSQSFRAAADNLARVRFWLDGAEGQQVYLGLSAEMAPSDALHVGIVTLRGGYGGAYYDLSFPSIRDSKGQRYLAWVKAPEATAEQAIALRIAPGDAAGGQPRLNGRSVSGNLDFATYHRGRLGLWWVDALCEQVYPHTFRVRIQQYKPDWAKGRAFGVSMIGATFLSVALLLVAWPGDWRWLRRVGGLLAFILACGAMWELGSGGLLFREAGATSVPGVPVGPGPRAVLDALMSDRPVGLEAARDPVTVEWVRGETDRDGRYALLTTAERPFTFGVQLVPGAALRFGLRASDPQTTVDVYWNDDRIWQGQADGEWRQVELELASYAGAKGTVRLDSQGEAWWSSPHLVSDEGWLLPYPLPEGIPISALHVRFGDEVELLGYAPERTAAARGESAQLILYWRALRPMTRDYTVFAHLVNEANGLCGGLDSYPVLGTFPTSDWSADRVVADRRTVPWSEDVPGPCRLEVGLYDLETMQRLPAVDASGASLPDARVLLDTPVSVHK